MGDIMKNHQCIGAFLAAAVVLGSLGSSGANAQSRTFFAPWVTYVPPGPVITTPAQPMTYQYYSAAPTYYSTYSMYNPYVAPYPAYGILPPPFSKEAVAHYCREEWAVHLDDVMVRRTSWQHYCADAPQKAAQAAEWMAEFLGWPDEEMARELARCRATKGSQLAQRVTS